MKKNVIKVDSLFNFLYILSYSLFLIIKVLQNTMFFSGAGDSVFSTMRYIILSILIIVFFAKLFIGISKNNLYFRIILIFLGFLTYLFSGNADCFCITIFIALASDMDYKKIIRASIIVNIIMLFCVIISCKLGILPDYVYSHESFLNIFSGNGHSLGFKHYSNPAFIILYVSIMLLFLKNSKKNMVFVLLINFVSFIVFTAKLPFFICIFYILLLMYFRKDRDYRISKKFWVSFPIVCVISSILLSFAYSPDSGFMSNLNLILNNRLKMGNIALSNPGISLLGQRVVSQGIYTLTYGKNVDWNIGYFFIDNDYLLFAITYGVILSIMILSIYCKSISDTINKKNYKLFVWIISTLIFAFVNSSLISIEFNPLLLVFMSLYYSDRDISEKEGDNYGI